MGDTNEEVRSRIEGWGFAVPETVITNDDLAEVVETSDEWVQKRSGIRERRYADDEGGSAALAERAARDAMAMAGIEPEDVDLVLYATLSPDVDWPGTASLLMDRLGLSPKCAMDLRNQCSGFVYGVTIADQYIRTGGARHVLVVGGEVHSSGLDYAGKRGRDVTVLFGDGAGAVVVGASDEPDKGLLAFTLHADGRHAERLATFGPAGRQKPRIRPDQLQPESAFVFPVMEGRYVFKNAVEGMSQSIKDVVEKVGMQVSDIDMVLPHQANLRINQFVAATLELKDSAVANNIDRYGNTTAATIPILLSETAAAGRIKRGDIVCMSAFGAGFTWGAALYRW
jgi:3-oxoacyl-[acyl-carrier-protein] synthase-3